MPDDITLHTSCQKQVTCISNSFIDCFMSDANGEYVKIYLYLLRCLHQDGIDFSISAMSDALDHTSRDIKLALKYWEKCHLLRLEYDGDRNLVGICLLDPDKAAADYQDSDSDDAAIITGHFSIHEDTAKSPAPEKPVTAVTASTIPSYTAEEVATFHKDPDIQEVFFVAEQYIGHPLTATDVHTILSWYDVLHMSAELIEYLIEYCVDAKHTSLRYMNTVAVNWGKEGITTVEAAKSEAAIHSQYYFGVMKAFGISGRKLIASEEEFIKRWSEDYAFSMDIITEACRRTILNTHEANFNYADSILRSWHQSGVKHVADVARLDQAHQSKRKTSSKDKTSKTAKNSFHDFESREYDYDDLERRLLQ